MIGNARLSRIQILDDKTKSGDYDYQFVRSIREGEISRNMQALQRWMNRGLKYLKLSNSLKTALRSQGLEHLLGIMN